MSHQAGVWIDHKTAVIVSIAGGEATTSTLRSDVPPHPHFGGSQEGGGEKKYEERRGQQLHAYYDDVIERLGRPTALLIMGPGEAKQELKERLDRLARLPATVTAIESADRLTELQIVARVKHHFGIEPVRL